MMLLYKYGMRLRGFSIGCQPMDGFIGRIDDKMGKYHDILIYNRLLKNDELKAYELDYLRALYVVKNLVPKGVFSENDIDELLKEYEK